jgi:2-polyprenyl-3-methyl-5-hydroxy-6-metoxy-1,4-benzoquinol methylase
MTQEKPSMSCPCKDTLSSPIHYGEFYEELGKKYPESANSHKDKGMSSRYWTVLQELTPYATRHQFLLDIGCNDGVYTIPFCQSGGRAVGLDISPSLVEKAATRASSLPIQCSFISANIESEETIRALGRTFDCVLMSEVLEHLRDPESALRNVRRALKPGGSLLLTTPTPLFEGLRRFNIKYILDALSYHELLERHVINTEERDSFGHYDIAGYTYRHDGYYPRSLIDYIEGFGFRTKKFYTISFLWAISLSRTITFDPNVARVESVLRRTFPFRLLGGTNVGIYMRT